METKETYIETVQEITLVATECIKSEIDDGLVDSMEFLSECRAWAKEFEEHWRQLQENDLPSADYMDEVEDFSRKKAEEYQRALRARHGQSRFTIAVTLPLTLWVEVWASDEQEAMEKAHVVADETPLSEWGDDMSTMQFDLVKED